MTNRIQPIDPSTSQHEHSPAPSPRPMSRRKLLAALGATGIAATSTKLWKGNDASTVFAQVYNSDNGKGYPIHHESSTQL
jgi:hypothetical protein